ncbi:MAG TPA: acyl-CoA desaturase, partial [Chromatiales bacterium]|nr:acyl-CoA desaturase [Chromatiales bacterium]
MQSSQASPAAPAATRYRLLDTIPFAAAHIACLAAIWTGVGTADLLIAAALYGLRMFGITAGYHRYFSHRSFKTSRVFAFVLAFLAQSSAQRGILWWASNHRRHHRNSDTEQDLHSPARRGFWYAHLGWFFTEEQRDTDFAGVPDLAEYPELVWLDRHPYLPAVVTAFLVWLLAGWSGLVVGFLWSTVALWHATYSINSLAHVVGRPRYVTGDQSRNNLWLALLTFGEGWHNNHHHYQSAVRQGFRWYEIDVSFYLLKALAAVGLVWDLRSPPPHVVRSEQRLRRAVVEKAADQLAASFRVETIVVDLYGLLAERRAGMKASMDELQDDLAGFIDSWRHQLDEKLEALRHELDELIRTVHLPAMPTLADLRARADSMFVATPSMNDIVERAR